MEIDGGKGADITIYLNMCQALFRSGPCLSSFVFGSVELSVVLKGLSESYNQPCDPAHNKNFKQTSSRLFCLFPQHSKQNL